MDDVKTTGAVIKSRDSSLKAHRESSHAKAFVSEPRGKRSSLVAIYDTQVQIEAAVNLFQQAEFDMRWLSVLTREYHTGQSAIGYYAAGNCMKYWGKLGSFWSGLWESLWGAGVFWMPDIGPLLVAGPLVGTISVGLEPAKTGSDLSLLAAAFHRLGISKSNALKYVAAIKAGKFLLAANGATTEIAKARDLISGTDAAEYELHH